MSIKLIVGLGNPGSQYKQTRHNVGLWFLTELIAQNSTINFKLEKKFKGEIAKTIIADKECILFFPTTFMNCSGEAIKAIATFYKIAPEEILIIHDDLDLPVGTIKFKKGGGHGGHNGLRNIIDHLHTKEFYRLRIGINHPGNRDLVVDYVLNKPSADDKLSILRAIDRGITLLPEIVRDEINKVMQELHTE